MKRVKAACLEQTLHFMLKEDLGHALAVSEVKKELAHYKEQLERSHTKYQILSEEQQPDGSLLVRIKKQYNNHDCGAYMD